MDLAKVERVYTSYAGIYDQIFGKVFHEGRESAIRNLNVQPNEKILEVGVGTGLALPMYPRHCQIVGIDFSEGMLDKAKGSERQNTEWATCNCTGWMPARWNSRTIVSIPSSRPTSSPPSLTTAR